MKDAWKDAKDIPSPEDDTVIEAKYYGEGIVQGLMNEVSLLKGRVAALEEAIGDIKEAHILFLQEDGLSKVGHRVDVITKLKKG